MRRFLLALPLVAAACSCGPRPGTQPGANKPPVVRITAPADGATLGAGPYAFAGTATDPEDGALSGAALTWTSSIDGALGHGASLQAPLSKGTHLVTLDAVDSKGAHGQASIHVTVTGANAPPQAFIDAPAGGTSVDQGQAVTLTGHANDPEDGALSGSSLTWTSSIDGALGTGASVAWAAPSIGTHTVVLTATDSRGATGYASITLTVVPAGGNHPPVATISSPANGATFTVGQAVDFAGGATDVEDGALSGASLAWRDSVAGALGTGASLTTSALALGTHVVTLTATDSQGAIGTAQITISVNPPNDQPPVATITAPPSGSTFPAGTAIAFAGGGVDPEDGTLPGTSLAWSSSLDGPLGTGASLTATLSSGTHTVTLTATDSQGATGTATIQVTVLAANQPPTAAITSPADGSSFAQGTAISFAGSGTDPEDGALGGASLTWRSSLDGVLGTGASLGLASLSVGTHQITLTAVDSGGLAGSASINLTVTPGTSNIPPIARISGPAQAVPAVVLSYDGSASSDADGTVVGWRFDFGDGSAPVSGSAPAASHAFASAGVYTVTLTVTDDQGATGSASMTTTVASATPLPTVIDSGPDVLGSRCAIALDANGDPRVAYHDDTHPSIWLATFANGAWTKELVVGMGYGIGGPADPRFALAVDATGAPQLAYGLSGSEAWWTTRQNGAWVQERVDPPSSPDAGGIIALALDPANGGRPTVGWSTTSGGYYYAALAYRTAANAWTTSLSPAGYYNTLRGGPVFDAAGTAYLLVSSTLDTWTPSGGFVASPSSNFTWADLAVWGSTIYALQSDGLYAGPLGSLAFSPVESFSTNDYALAVDPGGSPWVANDHTGQLELAHPDANGYWTRTGLGPLDSGQIDMVFGPDGPRVCFFRSGKLLVY